MQHFNVKIFAREPVEIDLAELIPVFHRWIQENSCDELLIDVASCRHLHGGPGVLLIGHEANYSLDNAYDRLGLLYNRKAPVEGGPQAGLRQAFHAALHACFLLEREETLRGKLRFDAGDCEVIVNDRLLAPNTEETLAMLRPDLEAVFNALHGPGAWTIERKAEPRERFRVGVRATAPLKPSAVLSWCAAG